jgi:hypothetical protein
VTGLAGRIAFGSVKDFPAVEILASLDHLGPQHDAGVGGTFAAAVPV